MLYEKPDDSIVFKIAKKIYMTKNLKYQTKNLLVIFWLAYLKRQLFLF